MIFRDVGVYKAPSPSLMLLKDFDLRANVFQFQLMSKGANRGCSKSCPLLELWTSVCKRIKLPLSQVVKCVYTVNEGIRRCVYVGGSFLKLMLPKSQTVCIHARKADKNNVSAAIPDHNFRRCFFSCLMFDNSNYVLMYKMKVQVEVRSDFDLNCHQRRTSCTFSWGFTNVASKNL